MSAVAADLAPGSYFDPVLQTGVTNLVGAGVLVQAVAASVRQEQAVEGR